MNNTNKLKDELEELIKLKKELQEKYMEVEKREFYINDIVNRSAIFDDIVVFYLARLLSYNDIEKRNYVPFIYNKYKNINGHYVEESYITIAPEDNLNIAFRKNIGYEIYKRNTNVINEKKLDKIVGYYDYNECKKNGKLFIYEFLLNEFNIKKEYPFEVTHCDFKDNEFVQGFIRYLFELQIIKNGRQLNEDEMEKAYNNYLELKDSFVKNYKKK